MSVPRWPSDVYRELYQERHGLADDDDSKKPLHEEKSKVTKFISNQW